MPAQDTTLLYTGTLGLNQTAWDRLAYFAFRPELFYDGLATVQPTRQTMPGSVVTFRKFSNLTSSDDLDTIVSTATLDERTDIDSTNFTDSTVSVTLAEYGRVNKRTRFTQATSYIPVDPVIANNLGYDAGLTVDQMVSNVLHAGTNVTYGDDGGAAIAARNLVTPTHHLTAHEVRVRVANFRTNSVPTWGGSTYWCGIHPDVSVDFREETGDDAWRSPQVYGQSQMKLMNGEIGIFEGVRFAETPRGKVWSAAGAGTTPANVYGALFVARQALAKAVPITPGFGADPRIVPGPVTDHLRRFVPIGWYHVVGYGIFRQESLHRVEVGSSLDTDYVA